MDKNIIVGTAQFFRSYGINNNNNIIQTEDVREIFQEMNLHAITHIDTANNYNNTFQISKIFKNFKMMEYVLKVSNDNKNKIEKIIEIEKQKFTKYPDTLLAHSSEFYMDREFINLCKALKENNKIKKIGVSLYSSNEIDLVLEKFKPDVVQLPLNIINNSLLKSNSIKNLLSQKIDVHIRSIFSQGLLNLSENRITKLFPEKKIEIQELFRISKKYKILLPDLSLLWVYNLKSINNYVLGVDNKFQLRHNVELLQNKEYDTTTLNAISNEILSLNFDNSRIIDPRQW
tara:strand:- start:107 stop:970 length:864 start_codon:yes stop_codon:yes gene_type:complete